MSDHVEVLRHMKETIKAIMPSEVAALDAAIAALSAPHPPAEARARGGGEVVAWHVVDEHGGLIANCTDEASAREVASRWENRTSRIRPLVYGDTAPPSAPVGDPLLQTALRNLPQYISKSGLVGPDKHSAMLCFEVLREALAQQPTADDVDTEQFRKGWQAGFAEGRRDQQPAAPPRCGDERYELDAYLWRRESTQEWVLELSGAINDTSFTNRFPVPLSYAPEDAVSLPNYVEQPAAVTQPERGAVSNGSQQSAAVDGVLEDAVLEVVESINRFRDEGTRPQEVGRPAARTGGREVMDLIERLQAYAKADDLHPDERTTLLEAAAALAAAPSPEQEPHT